MKKDAENWSGMIHSLNEHWDKFKTGYDFFGPDKMLKHITQVKLKAEILERWYNENPHGDDRAKAYLRPLKIGLDIDQVLASWVSAWCKHFGLDESKVVSWNFDRQIRKRMGEMKNNKEFWMNIKPLIDPADLPFEPHCYITARSIPKEWTEEWLDLNNFPGVPVHSVGYGESKIEVAKKSGVDVFVDDSYDNFCELNNAGVLTYLYDAPHNRKFDVGHMRIFNLKELM